MITIGSRPLAWERSHKGSAVLWIESGWPIDDAAFFDVD